MLGLKENLSVLGSMFPIAKNACVKEFARKWFYSLKEGQLLATPLLLKPTTSYHQEPF